MTASSGDVIEKLRFAAEGRADPYPLYHQLLEAGPLHHNRRDGSWYAVGYDACRHILLDPHFGHDATRLENVAGIPDGSLPRLQRRFALQRRLGLSRLRVNAPEHTRLRNAVRASFSPSRIDGIRSLISARVDECLDRMEETEDADAMADLAVPLAVGSVAELVGLPQELQERFRRAFTDGGELAYGPDPTDEDISRAERTLDRLETILRDVIGERRTHRRDDLISDLLSVGEERGEASRDEDVMSIVFFTFLAGFLTTTDLVGNGLLALLRHPEELARLRADGDLVATAVEEMLRWDSPIQWVTRHVLEPAEVEGVRVLPPEPILVMLGAANRDPERFAEPNRFDIGRRDNPHLAFGWGRHFCLGAPLARLEGYLVFSRIRERVALELREEAPPPAPRPQNLRGLGSLAVWVQPLGATRRCGS